MLMVYNMTIVIGVVVFVSMEMVKQFENCSQVIWM